MFKSISKRSLLLVLCDAVSIAAAFFLSRLLWGEGQRSIPGALPLGGLFLILATFFYIFDLYCPFKRFLGVSASIDIFLALVLGMLFYGFFCYSTSHFFLPRPLFFFFIVQVFVYVLGVRFLYDFIFQSRFLDKRVAILGTGDLAREIYELIEGTFHSGMNVVGYVAEGEDTGKRKAKKAILGNSGQLLSILNWHNINLLILAFDKENRESELEIMRLLMNQKIQIVSGVHLFEKIDGSIPYETIDPRFMLSLSSEVRARHYLHLKRLLDIMFSAILLAVTLPVSLLAVLLLAFQGWEKIFFAQKRVGKGNKIFTMYKFRSMSAVKGSEPRVTFLGGILRKFRIDEIPQFLNVLKGDMSMIGPRPETTYFANKCRRHIPYYNMIFTVQPGISGWAQVKFNHVSDFKDYPKKFCYNVYYLKNISLALDLQIYLKTIRSVFLGRGK